MRFWLVLVLLTAGCGRSVTTSSTSLDVEQAEATPDAPRSVAAGSEDRTLANRAASHPGTSRLRELSNTGPVTVSDLRFTTSVAIPGVTLHPVGDVAIVSLDQVLLLLEGDSLRRNEALNELRYELVSFFSHLSFAGTWPNRVWMANSWWSDPGPSCGTVYRWQSDATDASRGSWQPVAQQRGGISTLAALGDGVIAVEGSFGNLPETQGVWRFDSTGATRFASSICTDGDRARQPLTSAVFEETLRVTGHRCPRADREGGDPAVVTESWKWSSPNQSEVRVLVEDDAWVDALLFRDAGHLYGVSQRRDGRSLLALLDGATPELIGELPSDAVVVDAPGSNELWLIFAGHLLLRERGAWTAIPLSDEMARGIETDWRAHQVWRRGPRDIWLTIDGERWSLNHTGPISVGEGVTSLDTDEVIRIRESLREREEARANGPCSEGVLVELYKIDPFTGEADIDPAVDLMSRAQILSKVRAAVRRFPSARPVQYDCCGDACVGVTVSDRDTANRILTMLRRSKPGADTLWNESMQASCGIPPWVAPLSL